MKLWIIYIFSVLSLFGAQIDTTLFEGDLKARYETLSKEIESQKGGDPQSIERYNYQLALITKLQSLMKQPIGVESKPIDALTDSNVTEKTFMHYFEQLTGYLQQKSVNTKAQNELQQKILFLKNKIENLEAGEKEELLGYQLQFAIYKLQQANHKKNIDKLTEIADTLTKALQNAISRVRFSDTIGPLKEIRQKIVELQKKILSLQVQQERQLLTKEEADSKVTSQLEKSEKELQSHYLAQSNILTTSALKAIQAKDTAQFVSLMDQYDEILTHVDRETNTGSIVKEILQTMLKNQVGTAAVVLADTKMSVKSTFETITEWFFEPLFVYNEQPVSAIDIIKVILIIIIGFTVGRFYRGRILRLHESWPKMSEMSIKLLANVGYYIIIFITFAIALMSIGIDLTSLSLIAGALSIGIGFGLQTVVSNFVSGIILMFERTIRIGDLLEIDDKLKGEVTDMRIRSTTIKTFDNIEIIVPNATFIQNNVVNWTLEDKIRRLHIPFSIAYGTAVEPIQAMVLEALEKSTLNYVRTNKTKTPQVWMNGMGASSVDLELLVWINAGAKDVPLKSDFLILIYNTLNQNGIEIPFPQMDVHLKKEG